MNEALGQLMGGSGTQQLASGMHIMLVMTLLSLIPALLVLTTSFTRIIIVLGFLRQALGTPNLPPNAVLIPLAILLTLISMEPVVDRVYAEAVAPALAGKLEPLQAYAKAAEPLRGFLLQHTRRKDLEMLYSVAGREMPAEVGELSDRYLVPAFVLSELRTAFAMGFSLFLAFLAVDLVVAGILMALGMFMVPPMSISLPLKIMLFVLADGWNLVVKSLLESFR